MSDQFESYEKLWLLRKNIQNNETTKHKKGKKGKKGKIQLKGTTLLLRNHVKIILF